LTLNRNAIIKAFPRTILIKLFFFFFFIQVFIFTGCKKNVKGIGVKHRLYVKGIITKNTTWDGRVYLTDDLTVPEGVKLTINPGCIITVEKKKRFRLEPMFVSEWTEILVRGSLHIKGEVNKKVFILPRKKNMKWAGIIMLGKNSLLEISHTVLKGAQTGVYVLGGKTFIKNTLFTENKTAVLVQDGKLSAYESMFINNDSGFVSFGGETIIEKSRIEKNSTVGVWAVKGIKLMQTKVSENGVNFLSYKHKSSY